MLYKVGVLSNSNDAPFSIKDNNNDKSEKSLDNWGKAIDEQKLPHLITGNDNRFSGIAVDMWKKIASVLKINYRFIDAGINHKEAIEKLSPAPTQRMILEDCGHSPHVDHPNKTLDSIGRFVRDCLDEVRYE